MLGVEKSATDSEIKKAYRRLALEHHPDAAGSSDSTSKSMFVRATDAYELLSDPSRRAKYDKVASGFVNHRTKPPGPSSPLGGTPNVTPANKPAGGYTVPKVDSKLSNRGSPGAEAYKARRKTGRARSAGVQSTQDAAVVPMVTMAVVGFGALSLLIQSS